MVPANSAQSKNGLTNIKVEREILPLDMLYYASEGSVRADVFAGVCRSLEKMKEKKLPSDNSKETKPPKSSKDIGSILQDWEYEPGTINVRKITGLDGAPKLQMRLDLGLLQMELTGRPDGARPFGRESLLDYFEHRLNEYKELNGTDQGFGLSTDECQALREEAHMYYNRYLSLLVLEEYPGVVRDTARNIRVIDLCGKYAVDEQDRLFLEQYRPYITMMNAKAQASIQLANKELDAAIKTVEAGLERIRQFYEHFGHEEAFSRSSEARVLKRFSREIRKRIPVDPMERLRRKLDRAVKEERYEDAAQLRDQIEARKLGKSELA